MFDWMFKPLKRLFGINELTDELIEWANLVRSYNGKIVVSNKGAVRLEFKTKGDESRYWADAIKKSGVHKLRND